MKACIHRGAKEIGGSCIELVSCGERIILDLGLPLDAPEANADWLPAGLKIGENDSSLPLAIIISHLHLDHYGLLPYVNPRIPVYMGAASKRILNAAAQFMPAGRQFSIGGEHTGELLADDTISHNLENEKPFTLGPFTITPYLVDHSAYDAYALLIEADGEKLLYTGDIRMHGKKGILTERLSERLAGDVDVLLMEGTNLFPSSEGHQENSESKLFRSKIESEKDVENELVKEFNSTSGFIMIDTSSQNIDRIVSVFRACKRSGRTLIIDLYTAAVLAATGNENIPQSGWDGVKLFIPFSQRVHIKNNKLFDILKAHSENRIYMNTLRRIAHKSVMLVRPVHLPDLRKLAKVDEGQKSPLNGCKFIYSQWAGYLHQTSFDSFRNFLDEHQIPITLVHTSGHAFLVHLRKFAKTLNPGKIVPIHTSAPENFSKYFSNVELHPDGEFWEIDPASQILF